MRFFGKKKPVPDGVFMKCEGCGDMVYRKQVDERLQVCPECNYHFRIGARERVDIHTDAGTFEEIDAALTSSDPLGFVSDEPYTDKIASDKEKTKLNAAVVCGTCQMDGHDVVFAAMDFGFRGGSMGSAVGEKIARAAEEACRRWLPLVTVATSGGARMQEGALALMQMAKTCAALHRLHQKGLAHVSIMVSPTTAGVAASWASIERIHIFSGPLANSNTPLFVGSAGHRHST